ncbi:MAG: hypothetical protein P8Z37_09920 [Acidobacteriota bacterium]
MKTSNQFRKFYCNYRHRILTIGLLFCSFCFILSCSKTVRVYSPPNFDLNRFGRIGIITFADNADPSVGAYATEQFQNQIHSAQSGIPILQIGDELEVLGDIQANRLDFNAFREIGRKYDVAAVFYGNVLYSDIETDVKLGSIRDLNAEVNSKLHATLSVQLYETGGGATVWSDSVSWNRKLGKISVNNRGNVSAGMTGYNDAYRKLIPDMAYDVTREFRGGYVLQKVADNGTR